MSRLTCRALGWGLASALLGFAGMSGARAAELKVGARSLSITPDDPVALSGQMHTRISRNVESPVTANALAIEAVEGGKMVDQAIFVSCDLVAIREGPSTRFGNGSRTGFPTSTRRSSS